MIKGTPKADGIGIGSFSAQAAFGGWKVTAKVRLVNTTDGTTHFSTETGGIELSEDTRNTLSTLVEQLERDAAKHFLGDVQESGKKGLDLGPSKDTPPSGIGEHVGEDSI